MGDVTHVMQIPFDETRQFTVTGSADDRSVMQTLGETNVYEPHVTSLLNRLVQPDWVIADVGANVGALSLTLDVLVDTGHIHAFEPMPQTYGYLQRNIEENAAAHVTTYNVAVAGTAGELTFSYLPDFAAGAHRADKFVEGEQHTVPAIPLDDWAGALTRLDLVKIDVEGHELEVLRGAARTLDRFHPDLIVECNPVATSRFGDSSIDELLAYLADRFRWRFWIRRGGNLGVVTSRRHLDLVLRQLGYVDLFVTNNPSPAVLLRSRARAVLGGLRERVRLGREPKRFVLTPACRITADRAEIVAAPAVPIVLQCSLRNDGDMPISSLDQTHPFTLRHRWLAADGTLVREAEALVLFDVIVPGASADVTVVVETPTAPGRYDVMLSVVQEGFAWHCDIDPNAALIISTTVT
jgi:FkbM family methyltransferase